MPPATVVEMTLGLSSSALHFYDVSLVDGFNLPVSMKPVGGGVVRRRPERMLPDGVGGESRRQSGGVQERLLGYAIRKVLLHGGVFQPQIV